MSVDLAVPCVPGLPIAPKDEARDRRWKEAAEGMPSDKIRRVLSQYKLPVAA
jgi:hypothetical protein